MKIQKIATLALISMVLGLIPQAGATPSGGGASTSAEHCTVYNISKIIAVVNAGTEEICVIFDTDTPYGTSPYVRLRASGPDNALGLAFTQNWSIIGGTTTGCTTGSLTQSNGASAATSWANAYFTVTFNAGSTQCAGLAQYTLVVASVAILTWQGGWDTDVQSESSYVFNCAPTTLMAGSSNPDFSACRPNDTNNQNHCEDTVFFDIVYTGTPSPKSQTCLLYNEETGFSGTSGAPFYFAIRSEIPTMNAGNTLSQTGTCVLSFGSCASFDAVQGCTIVLVSEKFSSTSATVTEGTYTQIFQGTYTTGSNQCNILLRSPFQEKLGSNSPAPSSFNPMAITVHSLSNYEQADNQNRLCLASAFGAACTTPTINTAVTGTLTLSGTLDNLNRFCAASATGAACTTPTINVAVSGTLDMLDRLCGASATGTACNQAAINAVLSGNIGTAVTGSLALSGSLNTVISGTLDILDRLCGNSATGTACNQPTISIILSGTLDNINRLCNASGFGAGCSTPLVLHCSSAALTADPNACHQDGTVMNGNSTNIISLPQPLRVQAVCTSAALATDAAACGTPTLTTGQNLMLSGFIIGLLYFLAIMCSRFKEPAVNFFGTGLAAIAGFRAFDAAGGWLGGAMVIVATFTLCAWCLIAGGIRILNGEPILARTNRGKKDITEL